MRRTLTAGCVAALFVLAAQLPTWGGDWIWPLKAKPGEPNTLEQIARSIDCVEHKILDDGTVVIKQPDVYGQARMTLYRKNFEQQMYGAIGNFNAILSARLFRSDQAAFASQSNLATAAAAAKSKSGSSSNTSATAPVLISAGSGPGIVPNGLAPGSISRPDTLTAFGNNTPFAQGFAGPNTAYGLGVEPTVFLDELKRYQDHLNQIRRVNMGDDVADSAGYGLCLIRMPISIQPGECTLKGHGAILTATLRHDFGPEFLENTYRNLVINDLVDQLSPIVYELIRSGALQKHAYTSEMGVVYENYFEGKKRLVNREDLLKVIFFPQYLVPPYQSVVPQLDETKDATAPQPDRTTQQQAHRAEKVTPYVLSSLAVTRVNDRDYPIAPTELDNVFLDQNLYFLAFQAKETLGTKTPHATDIRTFLRRELESAYDIVAQTFSAGDPESVAIVEQYERKVEEIASHVRKQDYEKLKTDYIELASLLPGDFRYADNPGPYTDPINLDKFDANSSLCQVMTILSYSIAVEAGLLNDQLRVDMKRVLAKAGMDCSDVDYLRFFAAHPVPEAEQKFQEYVKRRWPIIAFAVDPTVDQQNIADASSVKRDLQLALAFAFSTGQINFNQLTQFQRRIETDAETIALNRTVTSFSHGDDTFGFRFTPRYQNPPPERSNFQVIGNQLLRGGPGRNYATNNSKLEGGQRELSVVVVMPSFLQAVQMDVTANWFPLHDPDHMSIPTVRMIEQGRKVVELQQSLTSICDQKQYRAGDLQRLATRVHQIEAMLPMQTRDVRVPYENTLGGFQLFQQGVTSLVPQLNGFEGAEMIVEGEENDLFLFGKHFSVQETNVVVGGKYLTGLNLDAANLQAAMNAGAPNPVSPNPGSPPAPVAAPAATVAQAKTAPTTPAANPAASNDAAKKTAQDTAAGGGAPAPTPSPTPSPATEKAVTATPAAANSPKTVVMVAAGSSNNNNGDSSKLNNPAVDVISREVIRINIPAGVSTTDILDANGNIGKYVEIYVATPNGISNRLLVPWRSKEAKTAAPSSALVKYTIKTKKVTIPLKGKATKDAQGKITPIANELKFDLPSASDKTIEISVDSAFTAVAAKVGAVFQTTLPGNSQASKFEVKEATLNASNAYEISVEDLAKAIQASHDFPKILENLAQSPTYSTTVIVTPKFTNLTSELVFIPQSADGTLELTIKFVNADDPPAAAEKKSDAPKPGQGNTGQQGDADRPPAQMPPPSGGQPRLTSIKRSPLPSAYLKSAQSRNPAADTRRDAGVNRSGYRPEVAPSLPQLPASRSPSAPSSSTSTKPSSAKPGSTKNSDTAKKPSKSPAETRGKTKDRPVVPDAKPKDRWSWFKF